MPDVTMRPIESDEAIAHLSQMAAEIWNGYWPAIIGQAQTDYMVEHFQSVPALTADIREHGYRYWIAEDADGRELGYLGGATQEMNGDAEHDAAIHHSDVVDARWPRRFFISKVYLYPEQRGHHYASAILDFVDDLCRNENLPAVYLTVNRDNVLGVRAYRGRGYDVVDEVDAPIGEGFVMTDYIMAKAL